MRLVFLRRLLTIGFLLTAGTFVWLLYTPGLPAPWTFDDEYSLQGLAQVHDLGSALVFVTSANGVGYAGRPLALASFLLNIGDWPGHPAGFRQISLLIHLLNGLLVGLIVLRVARLIPRLAHHAGGFAITLALVWLLHPLLASTALMAVQRMALLSASFTLLGMLAFLRGRALLPERPVAGYLWMSGGLFGFALLGYFCKENSALLPILAGVLEVTVLSRFVPIAQRYWTAWRWLFFVGPLLLLGIYVAWHWAGYQDAYAHYRGYSMGERLASQAIILWDYLRQILAPDITRMGPFQDDTARLLPVTPLHVAVGLLWLLAIPVAFLLRRRLPALAFAVLFFLTGHLLESTVIPLELYFEHRNYLPSLGPLAAIHAALWAAPAPWARRVSLATVPVMGFLLWSVTTTWGQPLLAAHLWAEAHPTSDRAAQNLANRYLLRGERKAAAQAITKRYRMAPNNHSLGVQLLYLSCGVSDAATYRRDMAQVTRAAAGPDFGNAIFPDLQSLILKFARGGCPHATVADLKNLVGTYLANSVYQRFPGPLSALHVRMAMLHEYEGDFGKMLNEYSEAVRLQPSPVLAESVVNILLRLGRHANAEAFYASALRALQRSSLPKHGWQSRMDALGETLSKALHAQAQHHPARP